LSVARTHNRVAVLHGVNFDMLGRRDPALYGAEGVPQSLSELEVRIKRYARELDLEASFFQTNHEGEFVEYLHRLAEIADGAIVNAGAWTHYSWAIHDALEIAGLPTVEVHLSDVGGREEWRRRSVLEGLVVDVVSGQGPEGYRQALEILERELGA
jgi:3-dehydroquinate dehydratase-2